MRLLLLAAMLLAPGTASACTLYEAKYVFDRFTEAPGPKAPGPSSPRGEHISEETIFFVYHPMIDGPIMVLLDNLGSSPALSLPSQEGDTPVLIDYRGYKTFYRVDGKVAPIQDMEEDAPHTLEMLSSADSKSGILYSRVCEG